eukprot:11802-Heterococcus_DN1.PRE.1
MAQNPCRKAGWSSVRQAAIKAEITAWAYSATCCSATLNQAHRFEELTPDTHFDANSVKVAHANNNCIEFIAF